MKTPTRAGASARETREIRRRSDTDDHPFRYGQPVSFGLFRLSRGQRLQGKADSADEGWREAGRPGQSPALAHRACDERGLEGRWPHVLARRAHRIDRSGQGWMVCSPDARSLRPPALLPAKRRASGAATPVVFQVQGVRTRAIGDQPGHPCHESGYGDDPPHPPFQPRLKLGSPIEDVRARKTRPCGRAPLMCAAAARARPDRSGLGVPVALPGSRCILQSNGCPTGVTGMDGSENPHAVGDGGSRSRAADRYSSAASLHGAECLALTALT
jgi:hypothetical protein